MHFTFYFLKYNIKIFIYLYLFHTQQSNAIILEQFLLVNWNQKNKRETALKKKEDVINTLLVFKIKCLDVGSTEHVVSQSDS